MSSKAGDVHNDLRSAIELWHTLSFEDCVDSTFWSDKNIKYKLRQQLNTLKLSDKKMDGFSVMGLEKSQEGSGGGSISYTETFFKMVDETGGYNPIDYLYLIVKGAADNGYPKAKTSGVIARGMRTFASLLRDHDFAFKIKERLNRSRLSRDFNVTNGSVEDAKNHTDVLVSSTKNDYRIWLFQFSKRGLPHDIERLTEQRGKLPKGIHILCPLKSEYQRDLEIVSTRIIRLSERIKAGKEKINLAKQETESQKILRSRLLVYGQALIACTAKEAELNGLLDGNIEPYHGWYLYGDKAVAETLDIIVNIDNGSIKPKPYTQVYDMLNSPKKYLSNLSSFKI